MTTSTEKVYRSRVVFWVLGILVAMMAVYMMLVIKKVPRSIESSKVGPFPELIERMLAFKDQPMDAGQTAWTKEDISKLMAELTPYEGLAMKRKAVDFVLLKADKGELFGRPLLQMRLQHPEGSVFSIAMYPIAKRHFPKTPSFVYKDAWFFQYGTDLKGYTGPAAAHVPQLAAQGLNLVATNYGNDYYLLVLGDAGARDLGRWLFEVTTIFSPRK